MSWREALEDGIPVAKDGAQRNCYYPPCHICGEPAYSWSYVRGCQYTCKNCRTELVRQTREEGTAVSADKKQKKVESAIRRISKVADIKLYGDAIRLVEQNLNSSGSYQSTEEIMVALELIRRGIDAHHQVRVFDYVVDFILPEMKVALEVDGKPFHGRDKQEYQRIRDDIITYKLGEGWETISIGQNINQNITRLIPGINAVLGRRLALKKIVKST